MPQIFPRKANALPAVSLMGALGGGLVVVLVVWYFFSPKFTDVGYQPEQPVPYSHALHAGEFAIDCRYCHNHVETSEHANIPSTQTCMNCHSQVRTESLKLLPVRESWAAGTPIPWVNVHFLPDYVQFSHAVHVNVGVGCESCHGRIDQMEEVALEEPLSMSWCLDCHRNPEESLRDPALVTQMGFNEEVRADGETFAAYVAANTARIEAEGIQPPLNCSACHY